MDEPVTPAAPVTEPAPAAEPAVVVEPAPAPWQKDIDERFTDPAVRAEVDKYLREKQQPYMTKLEQDAAELRGKAWVFDGLSSDDPTETLTAIVSQVYGDDFAERIVELLGEGENLEAAAAIAEQEADEDAIDLDKLPAEVREAVEFAKSAKAAEAAASEAAAQQKLLDEATATYDAWRAEILKAQPDVKENALHAYVFAADGDMEQGLANYRADFPAPAPEPKPAAPTSLGGATTGISNSRRTSGSLADAFGEVFDGAAGTVTL